jgi:SAM-dependent methyltransferase
MYENKVYTNQGNKALLACVPKRPCRILDVGCGAGDNARILQSQGHRVFGVTLSPPEVELARPFCEKVIVANAETDPLPWEPDSFDVLLLSHVIEHTIAPGLVLNRLVKLLKPDGLVLIAVPNVAHYRYRWKLLRGDWRRPETGPFDRTHYHFWSYDTVESLLDGSGLKMRSKIAGDASLPLWPFRRLLPASWLIPFDRLAARWMPNAACQQTIIIADRAAMS